MRTILIASLLIGSANFTASAADVKAGQAVYEKHCKTCHGVNGAAPPNVAKFQEGRMTDLRSSKVQSLSNVDLAKIVTGGKGKMRGDTTVASAEMENLAAYLHDLKG